MTLEAIYKQFLARPSANVLTSNAAINYIPTSTTVSEAGAIVKHFHAQENLLKKKNEEFKNVVEGPNSLCVESETTIQFNNGGGAYLPGIDESMICDRVVTIPLVHVVNFNNDKIQQVRLYWDMGSLLKSIEIIGKSGRNWPLRDCTEQLRIVNSSTKAAASIPQLPRRESKGGANGDKYTSLDLSTYPEPNRDPMSPSNAIGPAQSAKPAPREWNEIFANGEDTQAEMRSPSPSKRNKDHTNPLKIGAGMHHTPNRLFNDSSDANAKPSTFERPLYKSDPKKYTTAIDLAGAAPTAASSKPASAARNNIPSSSWSFDDFSAPAKHAPKQANDLRHFGIGEEKPEVAATPPGKPMAARPDAAAHFDISDRPTPEANRPIRTNSADTRDMYHTATTVSSKQPLSNISGLQQNANAAGKDHLSHFSLESNDENGGADSKKSKHQSRNNKHQGLVSSWNFHSDEGRDAPQRGIVIAGNGMGNRSGTMWHEQDMAAAANEQSKGPRGGIAIAGNGMGNRSGTMWHEQ